MDVGKFTVAAFAAYNENSLALANLNFNFALFKIEAPPEFKPLEISLSSARRVEAEDGPIHQAARKLGALFEEKVVPIPNLIRAYGRRVSEISASPTFNPRGTRADGMFQYHISADGTTIWAAATSGASAIAVNLLACLLARIWTPTEAVSIWVELVEERRKQIQKMHDNGQPSDYIALAAAKQDISRKELAAWDAGARAWLNIADKAKSREHTQLRLIVENISIPVNSSQNVYESAMRAWRSSMEALEKLVSGVAQRITDGATLLALSACYIYLEMDVYGKVSRIIEQRDPLVASGGRLTVGLEDSNPKHSTGMHWSLSLAHLKHYGDPVLARRSAGEDSSQVSFDDFTLVALGAFIRSWVGGKGGDIMAACEFITTFWEVLEEPTSTDTSLDAETALKSCVGDKSGWLSLMVQVARSIIDCHDQDRRNMQMMLVSTGMRRGSTILGPKDLHPKPAFGLTSPATLFGLLIDDTEKKIDFLRDVTRTQNRVSAEQMLIQCRINCSRYFQPKEWVEYASVVEMDRPEGGTTHVRWIPEWSENDFNKIRGRLDHIKDRREECAVYTYPELKEFFLGKYLSRSTKDPTNRADARRARCYGQIYSHSSEEETTDCVLLPRPVNVWPTYSTSVPGRRAQQKRMLKYTKCFKVARFRWSH